MRKKKPVPWRRLHYILTECVKKKDLDAGRRVHSLMISSRLDTVPLLGDHLIRLFAVCGSLQEAHQVFCKIQVRSVYTWNSIISAHVKLRSSAVALQLYHRMHQEGIIPDKVTFLCTLKACTALAVLDDGRLTHAHIIHRGLDVDSALGSALITFYSTFGCLHDARQVFDDVTTQDVVLWGTIISAYVQHGCGTSTLELFEAMLMKGLMPSHFITNCILKVCGSIEQVRLLHEQLIRNGLESDGIIGSSLVDAYAKFGDLDVAYHVFRKLTNQDVVSWGALISGYTRHGHGVVALQLFCQMQQLSIKPDMAIFLCVLEGCGQIGDIRQGRVIHDKIIQNGLQSDVAVGSSLVGMYATCGSLHEARSVFDGMPHRDRISWGAMIAGYMHHGHCQTVMNLFVDMQEEGVEADRVILLGLLRACSGIGAVRQGRQIHDQVIRSSLLLDVDVGNVLINMYAKCGSLKEARQVFDMLLDRNEVTLGAMMTGYVQEGDGFSAFELLETMPLEHLKLDEVVFLCALKACAITGVSRKGKLVHDQVIRNGLDVDAVVSNMLVHMYASCENPDEACRVFNKMPKKDVVSWGALITGLALNGNCRMAEQLLADMQQQGLKPDDTICTIMLTAYTHNGLLEEGLRFLKRMRRIQPTTTHYNCLIDLLSRTGHLIAAKDILQTIPFLPDMSGWMSLLTSSKTYGNMQLGQQCFNEVVGLDSNHASGFMLMSKAYADKDKWKDVNQAQELRKCFGASKKPGMACIEVDNKVQQFFVGGKSHTFSDNAYWKLKRLHALSAEGGYTPQLDMVLTPSWHDDTEGALCILDAQMVTHFELAKDLQAMENLAECQNFSNPVFLGEVGSFLGEVGSLNTKYPWEGGVQNCAS